MKWTALTALSALICGAALVAEQQQAPDPFRNIAERYVRLVLAVGQHDADYVDAYYGPPDWRGQAEKQKIALPEIDTLAAALATDLAAAALPAWKEDAELWRLRKQYLERQLAALRTRVAMLQGKRLTFDEESQALYDAVAPHHTEQEFAGILATLEK